MTRLDENRAKSQIAQRTNILVQQVKNVIIWGNHSKTQVSDDEDNTCTCTSRLMCGMSLNIYICDARDCYYDDWCAYCFIPCISLCLCYCCSIPMWTMPWLRMHPNPTPLHLYALLSMTTHGWMENLLRRCKIVEVSRACINHACMSGSNTRELEQHLVERASNIASCQELQTWYFGLLHVHHVIWPCSCLFMSWLVFDVFIFVVGLLSCHHRRAWKILRCLCSQCVCWTHSWLGVGYTCRSICLDGCTFRR